MVSWVTRVGYCMMIDDTKYFFCLTATIIVHLSVSTKVFMRFLSYPVSCLFVCLFVCLFAMMLHLVCVLKLFVWVTRVGCCTWWHTRFSSIFWLLLVCLFVCLLKLLYGWLNDTGGLLYDDTQDCLLWKAANFAL